MVLHQLCGERFQAEKDRYPNIIKYIIEMNITNNSYIAVEEWMFLCKKFEQHYSKRPDISRNSFHSFPDN